LEAKKTDFAVNMRLAGPSSSVMYLQQDDSVPKRTAPVEEKIVELANRMVVLPLRRAAPRSSGKQRNISG